MIGEYLGNLIDSIRRSKTETPSCVAIKPEHVLDDEIRPKLIKKILKNEDYFKIIINELFLEYSRQWDKKYDPMVIVVSEYQYHDGQEGKKIIPYVVGPNQIQGKIGVSPPHGMVLSNTRVAGLSPYRGDGLTLTVVLCQVLRDSVIRKTLDIIENVANVLDFSSQVSTYLKFANVMLDGIETLLESSDTQPLVGISESFDPFKPGYFALINSGDEKITAEELWIKDNHLLNGASPNDLIEYKNADYVLYSILPEPRREDIETLSFHATWKKVLERSTSGLPIDWDIARSNLQTLYQEMSLSPDLTIDDCEDQIDEWMALAKAKHEKAVSMGNLGPKEVSPEESNLRRKSHEILNM